MPYLNKVQLIGNLGKDPEIRVNQASGKKVVSFSIATSRRYRDNNGEQKEDTQWHNIVGCGKIAEVFEQLGIHKGTSLYVEGRLANRSWTDQNGQKRYVTEVNMDTFQLLGPRGQGGAPGAAPASSYNQQNSYSPAQNSAPAYDAPMDGDGDDLPF